MLDYCGQCYEFFIRGALAKALCREVVTIRSLEYRGVLCTPELKNQSGHWLYTRSKSKISSRWPLRRVFSIRGYTVRHR